MNSVDYRKIAEELHIKFLKSMHQKFEIKECPLPYPISFTPMLSLGGLGFDEEEKLTIKLNDTLILNPLDREQFEQTIAHESAHILHLTANGFNKDKPKKLRNTACEEPIGSIIADLASLLFWSLNGDVTRYFGKLSDYGGEQALKLYNGSTNQEALLKHLLNQSGIGLYTEIISLLGRSCLYEESDLEKWVLEVIR